MLAFLKWGGSLTNERSRSAPKSGFFRDYDLALHGVKGGLNKNKCLMKRVFLLGILFISSFLISNGTTYSCIVSSDATLNVNHCRALSSGNGDMCFTFGIGPACYETGAGSGVGG